MELNMGNKDMTLKEVFESINARLGHLEDICGDNRAIIVKLVKQGNQIIEYLKQLEIEVLEEEPMMSIDNDISLNPSDAKREERLQSIKEIIDDYMNKSKDLRELEKELKKHRHMLTPGQVGES